MPARLESQIAPACPACKSEPKLGALICPTCNYILDPRGAWGTLIKDPLDQCLQRLSRTDLEEMNISHLVAENNAEFLARLATEAKEHKKNAAKAAK